MARKKELSAKKLASVAGAGLILSLLIHLLSVFQIYTISKLTMLLMFAALLYVWVESSKTVKRLTEEHHTISGWKDLFAITPHWLKYAFYFLVLYGLLSFFLSAEFSNSSQWLAAEIDPAKIRGASGIWLMGFGLGVLVGYVAYVILDK